MLMSIAMFVDAAWVWTALEDLPKQQGNFYGAFHVTVEGKDPTGRIKIKNLGSVGATVYYKDAQGSEVSLALTPRVQAETSWAAFDPKTEFKLWKANS